MILSAVTLNLTATNKHIKTLRIPCSFLKFSQQQLMAGLARNLITQQKNALGLLSRRELHTYTPEAKRMLALILSCQ